MGKLSELVRRYPNEYDYCRDQYLTQWNAVSAELGEAETENQAIERRREAQKQAIDHAFVSCMAEFPDMTEDDIWALISTAHKLNLARLSDFELDLAQRLEVYDRCISAHQSWNKSSGHSFERYISSIDTPEMQTMEIRFLLKSDVSKLIKENRIANAGNDLHNIDEWADNFDLYAVQTDHGEMHIYGCIQVKTSIRDRVGRDDQFSKLAMAEHFWVAEAVLNGAFFNLPKYKAMVNGGSTTYPENNWNGVYVMTGVQSEGRIYQTDENFEIMANHAIQAARIFSLNRPMMNREWIAE